MCVYSLWLRVNTSECLDLHMQNSSQSSPRSCFSCSEEINGCLACGHTSAGSVSAMNDKLISSAAAVFLPPRVCVCVHVLHLCVFQSSVTVRCVWMFMSILFLCIRGSCLNFNVYLPQQVFCSLPSTNLATQPAGLSCLWWTSGRKWY